jgi:hypothetical protein
MMARIIAVACLTAIASTPDVSAQSPRTSERSVDSSPQREQAVTPATLTGCVLRRSDSSTYPTTSETVPGGASSGTDLILVTTESASPATPPSAVPGSIPSATDTGTLPRKTVGTASVAQGTVPKAYVLTPAERDLTPYVGQRLEVTGLVSNPPREANAGRDAVTRQGPSSAGTRAQVSDTRIAHPSSALPQLTVQTVKRVSGTCEGLQPPGR